jgi:hypothetical protein
MVVGASWSLGTVALSRLTLRDLRPYERVALRTLAGLGLTSLLLSLLALRGEFSLATPVLGVTTVIGAAWALVSRRRGSKDGSQLVEGRPVRGVSRIVERYASAAVLIAVILGCLGALLPVTDDDALAYVVPIARHIAAFKTVTVWPDQARSMWPQSQQVLLAYLLQLGSDRLGVLTALEFVLCVGAVSALARRACSRAEHVAAALVIGLGAPVVAFQISSAKEDLLVVAAGAAAACCLINRRDLGELAAAGLFAGTAAGAKYPGAAMAVAAILWPLLQRRERPFRDSAVIAVCASLTGGLWYGVNMWRYGNPVAPFFAGAPGTPLDAATVREFVSSYGVDHTLPGFLLAPVRIFLEPSRFCGRANLFNPLAYAGVAGLFAWRSRRRHGLLLFLAGVHYVMWFLTLQNARLLWPAAVLLAPAAADVLAPLVTLRPWRQAIAAIAITTSLGIVAAVGLVRAVRYMENPQAFLDRETQNHVDIEWMNHHLDRRLDRVASDHKALDRLAVPWLFLDPTYQTAIGPSELRDPGRFLEACRREGITHLFGHARSFPDLRTHLRPIYQNPSSRLGGVRFFREPPTESTVVFEIVYGAERF